MLTATSRITPKQKQSAAQWLIHCRDCSNTPQRWSAGLLRLSQYSSSTQQTHRGWGRPQQHDSPWSPTKAWWWHTLAFKCSLKSSYSGLRAPYNEPTVRNRSVSSTLRPHPQNDMGLRKRVAKAHGTRSVVRRRDATGLIWRTAKTNYLHKCTREQPSKVGINKTTDRHRRLSKDARNAP